MCSLIQLALFSIFTITSVISQQLVTKCDYANCPKPDPTKLNVHLVPHTHDDVGWLKTVDQYFYGTNANIQKAGVQYIIDSAINSLLQNDKRRFIYVETAFFWKWWKQQDPVLKEAVKELVANGRLEFISGGWSMNDEATAHYNSIVDEMTWGFRRLHDEFGKCGIPKVGWQIDPFGHSREQANLLAQMNFDGLFFARLDYQDREKRRNNKTLELIWKASDDLGKSSDLFTGAMDMGYGPPPTFCWDLVGCNDDPFIDDPESEDYNVDKIVDRFIAYAKGYSNVYATNNLLFPMGTDFQYQDAHAWFKNMDKLIKYVNARQGSNVNVFYSTPSCYLYGVQQSNKTFTTKTDDFFPYGSDPHAYWTGYFTSRPAIKRYERVGNNFLQVCKQIDVLAQLKGRLDDDISVLREAMGILQHHDAVSGTEKQHVANNYALKLSKGIDKCKKVVNEGFKNLLPKPDSKEQVNQVFCEALNISACAITEGNDSIAVTIYNPIGRPVSQLVRLPITNTKYQVFDPTGKTVDSNIVPIPDFVLNIPGRVSNAKNELVFNVDLPALGFATYLVKQNGIESLAKASVVTKITQSLSLKAKSFNVLFEADGGLKGIELNGNVVKVGQEFEYYKGMKGDNTKSENRASGAYVFRPDGQTPTLVAKIVESNLVETNVAKEVHQKLNSYITQVVRVYPNEDFVEFDYVVGPIPVADSIGKEIVSRFDSNLTTSGVFYTDANGRQVLRRVRNFRPTWNYTITEPTSGNYYPVNSRIIIRDEKQGIQMTVLNDRSQGGTSPIDGSVELMVHRRLLYDDSFGVGEPLNEPGVDGKGLVIRGKHWLLFSSIKDAAKQHRDIAQRIFLEPLITFSTYKAEADYYKNFQTSYSGLVNPLPKNVHLLTLEQWKDDSYLLRLEHFYQTSDDPEGLSKPATVDLKTLFKSLVITEATEQTLGGNQALNSAKRLEFKTTDTNTNEPTKYEFKDMIVTLTPMQIRTFIIKVKPQAKF